MEHLLVESAVRSLAIAVGIGAVLWATRMKAPSVLHAIWTIVMLTMLSLPVWAMWGPQAVMPVLPAPAASAVRAAIPAAVSIPSPPTRVGNQGVAFDRVGVMTRRSWNWPALALFVYSIVAGALLLRLAVGTARARRLMRRSTLTEGRLTSLVCAAPVTVGWLRPVVILPEGWRHWSAARLDAVLTHEQAHMRRRDPLVQWLALLNRAMFWFHPLAWWLERRLSALAEQACDEAVLADGHDPHAYSEYLIDAARDLRRGRRMRLAGAFMPGTRLPERIRRILDGTRIAPASRLRVAGTFAACVIVVTATAVATPIRAASQRGGDQSRLIVRPLQPRWIPPDSSAQPVALEWLDGDEWAFEVQSIITNDELRAYSELKTAPQRDDFIARFWARRDASPATAVNEFQEEFSRRIRFARENLADPQSHGTLGFDTDRGRVYLMFGRPDAIETEKTGSEQIEVWHYRDIADLGPEFSIRFSSVRGSYCGFRILSPAPTASVEAVGTTTDAVAPHASVQFYPFGLAAVSVPVDAARVIGAGWELRNRSGMQIDQGSIGFLDGPSAGTLSKLPRAWLDVGIGCTYALPADVYTLTTGVRFVNGQLQTEQVTFELR
jgi:GWxTD domain-containing protein